MKLPELLSPAGDMEKLRAAIRFGADAVYGAGQSFGMRAASANFSREELLEAVTLCHAAGKKFYVTVNVLPRDAEYPALRDYIAYLAEIGADAVIVSDIGVVMLVREAAPDLPIHLSTQASAVSAAACRAWHALGVSRVVLARELTLEEIREIRRNIPETLELEAFIHGAMCIAYSGRCLLSNYLVGRDANHGRCAQSCRWVYRGTGGELSGEIAEEKRPEQPLPIVEDGGDTFVLSSRDTCMIEHIPELVTSGIASLKIEGRVKSAYYTAVTANAYRMALDAYAADPEGYTYDPAWMRELSSVSHRAYATGFYFTPPHEDANTVAEVGYIREKAYLATAVSDRDADGYVTFVQRNKLSAGEPVELLRPSRVGEPFKAEALFSEDGEPIPSAPHPGMLFRLRVPFEAHAGDILRQGD